MRVLNIFALLIFISCSPKSDRSTSSVQDEKVNQRPDSTTGVVIDTGSGTSSDSSNPINDNTDVDPLTSSGNPECIATNDNEIFDCYRITPIIARGYANVPGSAKLSNAEKAALHIAWDSSKGLPTNVANNIFSGADARFNLRVMPKAGPSSGSLESVNPLDPNGQNQRSCDFNKIPYTKLTIGVEVRTKNFGGTYYQFKEVPVNSVSKIYKFPVPTYDSSNPIQIIVRDIEWDFGCIQSGGQSSYCPTDPVWYNDCVQFELQFSTDVTKDLVGEKIN